METIDGSCTIIQNESNKQLEFLYTQAAGVQTTFTINSDIEGATAIIIGNISKEGIINDGSCQLSFWQDEWTEGNVQASVSGDSSLLTPEQETYTFTNQTSNNPSFVGVGNTYNISEYWNIVSTYGNTVYNYPKTTSVNSSHTITLNEVPTTQSGTPVDYSPTQLVLEDTTSPLDSSISITQSESNKILILNYHQDAMALHTYTVNSDIEGATVQFGNSHTATVTDGQAILQLYDNEA